MSSLLDKQALNRRYATRQHPADGAEPPPDPEADSQQTNGRSGFVLLTLDDLARRPPPQWLVDGHLVRHSLAVCYGQPGSTKSFLALDIALNVASGTPWSGRKVTQGPVIWVAAEGVSGLAQRVDAWRSANPSAKPTGFYVLAEAVNLRHPQDLHQLQATLQAAAIEPTLIVFDTFARCLVGGDENSARDVGAAIATLDQLRADTGATTLVIHHTGKGGGAERGSSALRGAADTMLRLDNTDGQISLTCDKQKEAAPFQALHLKLAPAGDSCVLEYVGRMRDNTQTNRHQRVIRALTNTPPVSKTQLAALMGGRKKDALTAIDAAVTDPHCPVTIVREGRTVRYRLTPAPDQPTPQEQPPKD